MLIAKWIYLSSFTLFCRPVAPVFGTKSAVVWIMNITIYIVYEFYLIIIISVTLKIFNSVECGYLSEKSYL